MAEQKQTVFDVADIANGRVSVSKKFIRDDQVAALRADARALLGAGVFVKGGLRRRRQGNSNGNSNSNSNRRGTSSADVETDTDERTRLCDVCGLFDDAETADETVGDLDARNDLLDAMSDLREMLQKALRIRLLESMELQYLHYPGPSSGASNRKKAGFYGRHFDHTGDEDKDYRRKISLLLYLNEDGWRAEDGGILRAYARSKKKGGDARNKFQDVLPEGGTLVLFDSTSVEHEVLPTRKERWAVVGWFLIDKEKSPVMAVDGKRGHNSKRAHRHEEEHVHPANKRKKKRRKKKQSRSG